MAEAFAHCLFAMAVQGVVGLLFGLPMISHSVFLAGIVAMAIDMDAFQLKSRKRSVYSHSILFSLVWIYLCWMLALVVELWGLSAPSITLEVTLGVSVGLISHLSIDMLTSEGVYLFPVTPRPGEWFVAHPWSSRRAWGAWRVFPSRCWREVKGRAEGDGALNTALSVSSLLALVCYIALL